MSHGQAYSPYEKGQHKSVNTDKETIMAIFANNLPYLSALILPWWKL